MEGQTSSMCCAVFLESGRGSVGGSVLLALGIGIAFGLLQGFLIAYLEIQPFIITLAGMYLANGLLTTIHKDPLNVTMRQVIEKERSTRSIFPPNIH